MSVEDSVMHVPILKTLQTLLQNKTVVSEVSLFHKFLCFILSLHVCIIDRTWAFNIFSACNDYCDGKYFKAHPLFSVHPNGLQIFLYFDELEICNPIGSKVKVHKLGLYT